jgi:hypothetical protein
MLDLKTLESRHLDANLSVHPNWRRFSRLFAAFLVATTAFIAADGDPLTYERLEAKTTASLERTALRQVGVHGCAPCLRRVVPVTILPATKDGADIAPIRIVGPSG